MSRKERQEWTLARNFFQFALNCLQALERCLWLDDCNFSLIKRNFLCAARATIVFFPYFPFVLVDKLSLFIFWNTARHFLIFPFKKFLFSRKQRLHWLLLPSDLGWAATERSVWESRCKGAHKSFSVLPYRSLYPFWLMTSRYVTRATRGGDGATRDFNRFPFIR